MDVDGFDRRKSRKIVSADVIADGRFKLSC